MQEELAATTGEVLASVDRLFDTARPEAVFAAPVSADGRTVIGAAEVLIGTIYGGGGAYGPATEQNDGAKPVASIEGGGVGAGIGGFGQSRPVAVIIIEPDGVRVEPVVDATKIGLAALTVMGSMFFFLARMLRGSGS